MGPITKSIMSLLRDAKTPPILYQCQPTNSGWILSSPVTQWLLSLVSWQHSFQVDVRSKKTLHASNILAKAAFISATFSQIYIPHSRFTHSPIHPFANSPTRQFTHSPI